MPEDIFRAPHDDLGEYFALSPVSDTTAVRQLGESVRGPKGTVGALLPGDRKRYIRIPHSATDQSLAEVTWKAVANATGRVWHPLMEWERIRQGRYARLWSGEPPMKGEMPAGQRKVLFRILRGRERAPVNVLYGFNLDVFGGEAAVGTSEVERFLSLTDIESVTERVGRRTCVFLQGSLSPGEPLMKHSGEWVELPWFDYVLCPSRDWCLASSGDLDSSYLACSDVIADTVLKEPGLETLEIGLSDSITAGSDLVNRPADSRR